MICMYCGFEYKDGVKFCPSCGKKTVIPPEPADIGQVQTIACSKCGKQIKKDIKFCNFCGSKVQNNSPADNADANTAASDDTVTCSKCGKQIKKDIKFCNFCGCKVQNSAPADNADANPAASDDTVTCSKCHKQVRKGIKFCNFCGYKIPSDDAAAVPDKKPGLFSELPAVPAAPKRSDKQTTVSPTADDPDRKIADAFAEKKDDPKKNDVQVCSCGFVLRPGVKFCPKCGQKIADTSAVKPADNKPELRLDKENDKPAINPEKTPSAADASGKRTDEILKEETPKDSTAAETKPAVAAKEPSPEILPTVSIGADSPERKIVDDFLKEEAAKNPVSADAAKEPSPEILPTVSIGADSPERKIVDDFLKEDALKNKDNHADEDGALICSCGNKLNPGAKFCTKCGKKVGEKPQDNTTTLPEINHNAQSPEILPTVTLNANSEERKIVDAFLKEEAEKKTDAPVNAANASVCSCGNQLKPGAKFCTKCGKKVEDAGAPVTAAVTAASPIPSTSTVTIPVSSNDQQQAFAAAAVPAPRKPLSNKVKIIIASCGAGLLILITIIIILVNATPTIHLSDYMNVEYEGYNGYGTLNASFDYDRFRADWMGKLRYQGISMEVPSGYYDFSRDPSETILSHVGSSYCRFSKTSNLSNDDKIKLHWNMDQTKFYIEKAIKVNIDTADVELTVSGLKNIGTFDPFGGLTIRYTGYNGNGKPEIASSNYSLDYSFDKTSGLKNGDTIHVTVSSPYGEDLAKYCASSMGSVPSATGKDYIVEGLPEMKVFDAFEGITVTFEGTAPNGKAVLTNNSNKNLRYQLDKNEGLSNGDKVTVTVSAPYGEELESYCKDHFEAKPNASTKVFTVNTLGKYITTIDELPASTVEILKTESKDCIESDITDDVESVEKIDYQGMIILNLKEGKNPKNAWSASSDHDHMLLLTYMVTVKIKDNNDKTSSYTYWTACRFNDITLLPDGTCEVDTNEIVVPNDSVSPEKSYKSFRGYESYDQLFKKLVNTRLTDYKYETKTNESDQPSQPSQTSEESKTSSEPVSEPSQTSEDSSQNSGDASQSSSDESSSETTSAAESSAESSKTSAAA